jgi:hypothetical protein
LRAVRESPARITSHLRKRRASPTRGGTHLLVGSAKNGHYNACAVHTLPIRSRAPGEGDDRSCCSTGVKLSPARITSHLRTRRASPTRGGTHLRVGSAKNGHYNTCAVHTLSIRSRAPGEGDDRSGCSTGVRESPARITSHLRTRRASPAREGSHLLVGSAKNGHYNACAVHTLPILSCAPGEGDDRSCCSIGVKLSPARITSHLRTRRASPTRGVTHVRGGSAKNGHYNAQLARTVPTVPAGCALLAPSQWTFWLRLPTGSVPMQLQTERDAVWW